MKMHIDLKREGFQMTRERRRSNHEWPAWLNIAWNTPITDVGAVYPDPNDPDRGNGLLQITDAPHSTRLIQWNDWIIREADGRLWVTDSTDPTIANIEIPAGPELKQAPHFATPDEKVQTLDRLCCELRAELAEAKKNYAGACETICRMHSAAVGGIMAPNRGVVEDVADVAERLRLLELSRTDPEKSLAAHAVQLNATLRKTQEELRAANALLDGLKRPNPAAIDQVAESLCSLVGDDGRFREDIRRILREHFGEFGTNDRAELDKLRGYYRQIVATLGDDAVISRVRSQADTINRLNADRVTLSDKIGELTQLLQDEQRASQRFEALTVIMNAVIEAAENDADRLANALGWLASTCGTQVAAVTDALRAHAHRRGAHEHDAGPIQSRALVPAAKIVGESIVFHPGAGRSVLVHWTDLPDRTKLVLRGDVLFHVRCTYRLDSGVCISAVTADPAIMDMGENEGEAPIPADHVTMTPAEEAEKTARELNAACRDAEAAGGIPIPPIPESGKLDATTPDGSRVVAVRETVFRDMPARTLEDVKKRFPASITGSGVFPGVERAEDRS